MHKVVKALASNCPLLLTGGLFFLTLLSGLILSSISVSADGNDSAVDNIGITVPAACTLEGTINTGDEHTASVNAGTYTSEIGYILLKSYCNDLNGFSIYAIGYTGDSYTGEDHTKLIGVNTN